MFNGEGGTLEGTKDSGAIASHVERKSHYLVAAKLADKAAATMTTASAKALRRMPHCVIAY
jgi:IS30 family transposase